MLERKWKCWFKSDSRLICVIFGNYDKIKISPNINRKTDWKEENLTNISLNQKFSLDLTSLKIWIFSKFNSFLYPLSLLVLVYLIVYFCLFWKWFPFLWKDFCDDIVFSKEIVCTVFAIIRNMNWTHAMCLDGDVIICNPFRLFCKRKHLQPI